MRRRDDDNTPGTVEDVLRAAALSYDDARDNAPKLAARGRGLVAERLLEIANEHGVAIRRDPTLIGMLETLDVGVEIPYEMYGVIAEVLAWAYASDRRAGARSSRRDAA